MADKLDQVRKLLAMAEGTKNEHEAAAFLAKAQGLMTEYGIDEAMARRVAPENADKTIEREMVDIPGRTQLIKAKRGLLAVVAENNSCIVLIHTNGSVKSESITGYRGDRERVKLLFSSLLLQMERAMRQDPGFHNDITYRNNFAWGYVSRIQQRLAQARTEAHKLRGGGAELALRDTMTDVQQAVGKVKKASQGKRRKFDPDARSAGDAAGNRAVLDDRLAAARARAELDYTQR